MRSNCFGRSLDQGGRFRQTVTQHAGPHCRDLVSTRHEGGAIVGALDLLLRHMCQHKIDDGPIVILAVRSAHSFMIVENAARKPWGT